MPIHLETYLARIKEVYVTTDLKEDHSEATVEISVTTAGNSTRAAKADIIDSSLQIVASTDISLDRSGCGYASTALSNLKLWWPNGQGAQHLYTVSILLLDSTGNNLDARNTKIGIKIIRLIQRPLSGALGKTFIFNVNSYNIFA